MTAEPTILMCVGATKAGTSWLHRYLSDHPDCALRSVKELHYFDALDCGHVARREAELAAQRAGLLSRMDGADAQRRGNLARQAADVEALSNVFAARTDAAYLDYLTDGAEGRLVADMTPAYGLLSERRMRSIAEMAGDVRVVYLMRDPVARLWSHVRMIAARRDAKAGPVEGRASRILSRVFSGAEHEIAIRSDYASTLTKLAAVVRPEKLFVGLYERVLTVPGIAGLCRFLGIGVSRPDLSRRIHAGPPGEMSVAERRAARAWLARQYDFVADWLGERPAEWRYGLQEA